MDTTITGIGAVVVAKLRSAGYMESTTSPDFMTAYTQITVGTEAMLPEVGFE